MLRGQHFGTVLEGQQKHKDAKKYSTEQCRKDPFLQYELKLCIPLCDLSQKHVSGDSKIFTRCPQMMREALLVLMLGLQIYFSKLANL